MVTGTPEALYRYCRIDDDDTELQQTALELADAAEDYLTAHRMMPADPQNPRAALCVRAMTLHDLDHPGEAYPGGILGMLNDLKFRIQGG